MSQGIKIEQYEAHCLACFAMGVNPNIDFLTAYNVVLSSMYWGEWSGLPEDYEELGRLICHRNR